ncbi:papain-like cysteine protease family protein, partial [Mesorhizobium sp.]|uniref:papain-like cysteine protease family protein n=1 Tax=Mesorhizobium sp. TaxID=1871066 RepID=UPI00257FD2F2
MARRVLLLTFCMLVMATPLPAATIAIKHNVDPIAQPSDMSCWAAAATMLKVWKLGISRSIVDVVG